MIAMFFCGLAVGFLLSAIQDRWLIKHGYIVRTGKR